ncbi:hypothetical protein CJ671_02165 [Aliarcobacter cryaerophilus]|uniref:RAP domain-containing protein n=1 Tax=Aliarcobacter cryaerophilus TaxID=28198 RepID=A0A2S9SVK5_9BACT|nr:DUF4011 domain-containing protein [Aliarcobacter cryaerophilus]PRM90636.1 hypothetical protein CJ671_02165 [Aliarcobacter cryaerophilus]
MNNLLFVKGINELRDKLIDTSRRNKLINYKRQSKSKNLKIIDESAEFIYNFLLKEEGKFKFNSIPEPTTNSEDLKRINLKIDEYKKEIKKESLEKLKNSEHDGSKIKQLELSIEELENEVKKALLTAEERAKELGFDISNELPNIDLNDLNIDEKYTDNSLQTLHYPNEMEKILRSIERDSKNIIEETGSNMLYLILGLLKWKDTKNSEEYNHSPLISIPIILNKFKGINKYEFTLEYSGEAIDTNKSLAEKLNNDYGIILPELNEESTYIDYLKEVQEIIKLHKDWSLKHEIAIDFLKFGKILMYQDLKEENWNNGTKLSEKEIFIDIFNGKEVSNTSLFSEEYDIDENKLANKIPLAIDADSSQHSAIVDVLKGKNVVIEGPPGTGKSQTISNLIAVLLAEGKSVLFVSEKLAALEVVHKRLEAVNLSDFCLELHSNKSQKTKILDSIKKRVEAKYDDIEILSRTIEEIEHKKKELKTYINLLHENYGAIEKKVYTIFWSVEKYNKTSKYLKFDVPYANEYTPYKFSNTIEELKKYRTFLKEYDFNSFYWKGLDVHNLSFVDIDNFIDILKSLKTEFTFLENEYKLLNTNIENEYKESQKIDNFINEFNKNINFEYSVELLRDFSENVSNYENYISNFKSLKESIRLIEKDLDDLEKYTLLNENIILNIVKIDKILKHIKNETNISNNKNIEFIKQIVTGIKFLSDIDLNLYTCINPNFIDASFLRTFETLKKDLEKYSTLKETLSNFTKISEIDKFTIDEIIAIEKIINEKKDSFFNIFSKEYKTAKNKINNVLKESLPTDKSKWNEVIIEIKNYITYKISFENNDKYLNFFGRLFNGEKTSLDNIAKLYNWVLALKQDINITEVLNQFLDGNESRYSLFISYKESLLKHFEDYLSLIDELEKNCDKKFIKKLYYDKDDVDVIELKDKLEIVNENLETFTTTLYKKINLNKNNCFEDELIKLVNEDLNIEDIIISIKKCDVGINDLFLNFENFINTSLKLMNICKNINIESLDKNYESILGTKKLYKLINDSELDFNLKIKLYKDFSSISILQNISNIQYKINDIYNEIKTSGNISDDFYGVNIGIRDCINKLEILEDNKRTLSVWINYKQISHDINEMGLTPIVEKIENKELPVDDIIKSFKYNFYHTLIKEIFKNNEVFNKFNRLSHEQSIKRFKELDLELIKLNKQKIAYLASKRTVPLGYRGNRKTELTEFSLLENELNKKKRHIPLRQLVSRASGALKALKPCFMMSPLSVSQYLPPNKVEFDVLIVDEASQLRPEEALGSIARAKQIVIVGDPKQLPPTSFFDSISKNEEEDTVASESESILDICLNLYKPIRQLRWHYRSQHETLIDFSNHQFYDGNLIVFPSPSSRNSEELGIKYYYIENSAYQSSRNKVEAKIIIEHLEKQMKNYPNRSIGIGTFNSTQRDLIQEMVDEREKESTIISNYILNWSTTSEPFFVKNLENLQGDERDVIIISTTFGKDKETGKVYQRFGPINSEMGWRRLNVLFTRSKQKMEIFTSLKSNDIIVSENSSRGVKSLKAFLKYLEVGTVTEAPLIINKGFDSEFEESVYNILNDCGFKAIPQVGVAGYFIDLAVTSTKNPNDFVLAIECDGATYHSSKSARDRDRLKQDVLEKLGWNIYRIWSVDWFKNRENEISKLIAAVKKAQANYQGKAESISVQEIEIKEVTKIEENINDEIKKEKEQHDYNEETLLKSNYSQLFLSDEKIKEMLIKFREEVISQDFEIDRRCILSDMMIELFVKHKPLNIDDFRNKIPKRYRDERIIHIDQLKYLNDIFDILELGDE